MRWLATCLVVLLAASAACDRPGREEVEELRREVTALRRDLEAERAAADVAARRRAAVRDALRPVREAVERLTERHEAERSRIGELADAIGRLAGIVEESARAEQERAAVADLRKRFERLQADLRAEREGRVAERDLILEALEATAERLEDLLRITPPSRSSATAQPTPVRRKSDLEPVVVLGIVSMVLAAVVVVLVAGGYRDRGSPVRMELGGSKRAPAAPEASAPDSPEDDVPERMARPRPLVVPFDGDHDFEAALEWIRSDPRVLVEPPPRVRREGQRTLLECHVAPALAEDDVERLIAQIRWRARAVEPRRDERA